MVVSQIDLECSLSGSKSDRFRVSYQCMVGQIYLECSLSGS